MNRRALGTSVAAAIGAIMFALAFVVAPHSCEGGLGFYFWSGVAALVLLLILPFVTHMSTSLLVSFGWGVGFLLLGVGVWLGGLVAANVRIICRLF